jgi:hypothetical protein
MTFASLLPIVLTGSVILFAVAADADCPPGNITVINMVPYNRSGEEKEDSEPSLAVNPANPFELVATAFTPDPMGVNAPIYFSTDGGSIWYINPILMGNDPTSGTNDASVSFGGMSGNLYAAIIQANSGKTLKVLFTPNFSGSAVMSPLFPRVLSDQPHLLAVTAWGGSLTGNDLVYVTSKDFNSIQQTSTLDQSTKTPLPASSSFAPPLRLGEVKECNEDGVAVLSAPQLSGRVYGAFIRWKSPCDANPHSAELIILRDDDWGVGSDPFRKLIRQVGGFDVRGALAVPNLLDLNSSISSQRIVSRLAIAVSPKNHDHVFLVWGEGSTPEQYALHVARSTDAGQSWTTSGLPTIPHATNPALAVNIHGLIGLLYQQYHDTSPTNKKWGTHFVTSRDNLSTLSSPEDLAIVPDSPLINAPGPLGDYLQLSAVGKNFYGVFSCLNNPNCDYFPSGISYQRNVDWSARKLLKPGVNPLSWTVLDTIHVSTDPFFFKVTTLPPHRDFYVRDWTVSALLADPGLEPSSRRAFYTTSDVWNRRGSTPGGFTNDQPQNESATTGAGFLGDNWAYARIRRNAASSSGSTTVTAHFLVSKFGTGSNFVDASSGDPDITFPTPADPTVTFAANDVGPLLTPPYPWHLSTTSSHLCMAVEISSPDDPFVSPSLRGNTPGWSSLTDLRVMYDNNRAQRNIQTFSIAKEANQFLNANVYAIIHNSATFRRDITLLYEAPAEVVRALPHAYVQVLGRRPTSFRSGDSIVLEDMEPGENRWVSFTSPKPVEAAARPEGTPPVLPVYFYEMLGAEPVNGFAIGLQSVPGQNIYPENIREHAAVFERRVFTSFPDRGRPPEDAGTPGGYLYFLQNFLATWKAQSGKLLDSLGMGDPFELKDAGKALGKSVERRDAPSAATLHLAFLNRLDAFATMIELSQGDLADILQTVRWQDRLFQKSEGVGRVACRDSVLTSSNAFIRDYSSRIIGNEGYSEHIRSVLPCLRSIATDARRHRSALLEACDRMQQNLRDPRALQRAHRDYLLELEKLE